MKTTEICVYDEGVLVFKKKIKLFRASFKTGKQVFIVEYYNKNAEKVLRRNK